MCVAHPDCESSLVGSSVVLYNDVTISLIISWQIRYNGAIKTGYNALQAVVAITNKNLVH